MRLEGVLVPRGAPTEPPPPEGQPHVWMAPVMQELFLREGQRSLAVMLGWTAPLPQVAARAQDRACDSDNGGGT
jgi:hypothetical protein